MQHISSKFKICTDSRTISHRAARSEFIQHYCLNRVHFENRSNTGPRSGKAPATAPQIRAARLRFPNWTRFISMFVLASSWPGVFRMDVETGPLIVPRHGPDKPAYDEVAIIMPAARHFNADGNTPRHGGEKTIRAAKSFSRFSLSCRPAHPEPGLSPSLPGSPAR